MLGAIQGKFEKTAFLDKILIVSPTNEWRSISMIGEEGIAATANYYRHSSPSILSKGFPVEESLLYLTNRDPLFPSAPHLLPTGVRACTVKSTRGVEFQKRARRSVVASLLHSSANFHEPCNVLEKSDTERRTGMHQLVNP